MLLDLAGRGAALIHLILAILRSRPIAPIRHRSFFFSSASIKPQFGSNSGLLCGVRINRWSHDTASIMTSVGKKSFSQSCFCERKSVSLFSVLSIGVLYWANGKQWANSRVLWTIGKQCVCDVCSDFLLTTAVYCNSHGRGGKRPVPGFGKRATRTCMAKEQITVFHFRSATSPFEMS